MLFLPFCVNVFPACIPSHFSLRTQKLSKCVMSSPFQFIEIIPFWISMEAFNVLYKKKSLVLIVYGILG